MDESRLSNGIKINDQLISRFQGKYATASVWEDSKRYFFQPHIMAAR